MAEYIEDLVQQRLQELALASHVGKIAPNAMEVLAARFGPGDPQMAVGEVCRTHGLDHMTANRIIDAVLAFAVTNRAVPLEFHTVRRLILERTPLKASVAADLLVDYDLTVGELSPFDVERIRAELWPNVSTRQAHSPLSWRTHPNSKITWIIDAGHAAVRGVLTAEAIMTLSDLRVLAAARVFVPVQELRDESADDELLSDLSDRVFSNLLVANNYALLPDELACSDSAFRRGSRAHGVIVAAGRRGFHVVQDILDHWGEGIRPKSTEHLPTLRALTDFCKIHPGLSYDPISKEIALVPNQVLSGSLAS